MGSLTVNISSELIEAQAQDADVAKFFWTDGLGSDRPLPTLMYEAELDAFGDGTSAAAIARPARTGTPAISSRDMSCFRRKLCLGSDRKSVDYRKNRRILISDAKCRGGEPKSVRKNHRKNCESASHLENEQLLAVNWIEFA